MAPLRRSAGGERRAAGRLGAGGAAAPRRRARADRRYVVVVVRGARLPPPRAGRSDHRPAGEDGARDVRRPHARAGGAPGGAPRADRPARPRAGVLRRLRLGRRGGGDQDVPAVPARGGTPRAQPAAHGKGRLPRRHVRRDGRVRSGGGDAQPVHGDPARARLRRPSPGRFDGLAERRRGRGPLHRFRGRLGIPAGGELESVGGTGEASWRPATRTSWRERSSSR